VPVAAAPRPEAGVVLAEVDRPPHREPLGRRGRLDLDGGGREGERLEGLAERVGGADGGRLCRGMDRSDGRDEDRERRASGASHARTVP
jgi:hypothetical protein